MDITPYKRGGSRAWSEAASPAPGPATALAGLLRLGGQTDVADCRARCLALGRCLGGRIGMRGVAGGARLAGERSPT